MSDTETGKTIELPPRDEFVPSADGLTAWAPRFTIIAIDIQRDNRVQMQVRVDGGVAFQATLNQEAALHLAKLLMGSAG